MERNWTNNELILVNRLLNNGKIDDDIYYVLSNHLQKIRERHIHINRELNGMNINEILFDLDRFNIEYNTMSVEKILRYFLIDTFASQIADIHNSRSPHDIMIEAYLGLAEISIVDFDAYALDVWGFYTLLENAGVSIVNLFTNELNRLRILGQVNRLRVCNTSNNHVHTSNYNRF